MSATVDALMSAAASFELVMIVTFPSAPVAERKLISLWRA
jgi:hypothetical protein